MLPSRLLVTTVAAVLMSGSVARAADRPAATKIDRGLRALLASGAPTQHVIISVKPGCRAGVRQALAQHGDAITAEYVSINAISGEIHSSDIATLATQLCVTAVSLDAAV